MGVGFLFGGYISWLRVSSESTLEGDCRDAFRI